LIHWRTNWRLTVTNRKTTRFRTEFMARKRIAALQQWGGGLCWTLYVWNGREHELVAKGGAA
jgi:hypothetical protein